MSGQENVTGSEVSNERSFFNVNRKFEDLELGFAAHIGEDKRFNRFAKNHSLFMLGVIAGVNEVLWKAYHFGPARDVLQKPENVTQYITLFLRLKALYEKYLTAKRIDVSDIIEDLDDITLELVDFSREVMKQSRCERPQSH